MKHANPLDQTLPLWLATDGKPIPCIEKIKVMNENYQELEQLLRDFLEDGVLMGCSQEDLRSAVCHLAANIELTF